MRTEELIGNLKKLKEFKKIHSVILFGSVARREEKKTSDIDLCVITKPMLELSLKEKLKILNQFPKKYDISFFDDLPLNIRAEVIKEGRILFTLDNYYLLTRLKEIYFELPKYNLFKKEYHKAMLARVEERRISKLVSYFEKNNRENVKEE